MEKTAAIVMTAVLAVAPAVAQPDERAQASASPPTIPSSSEKVRENPVAQYVLVKTVVGQVQDLVDVRAAPVDPEGYNLLKYCWTADNVLGDWAQRAGMTGEMVVRALETRSWQRDLARVGYPEAPAAQAIGRYEAALVAAGLADAARSRAVDTLITELDGLRRSTPGAAQVRAVHRCESRRRSLELNVTTVPADGRVRLMPYVLHQVCEAQQLNPDDPIRCDYWMHGRGDKPMSFAGETVYSVRWADGTTANGRFDPEQSRSAKTVTLRLRPAKAVK